MEILASTSSTMLPSSAVLANEDHGVKVTIKLLDYIIAICQNPYSQSMSLHDLPSLVKEVADYDEEYEALRKDKQRMGYELRKSRAECRQAHMRVAELEKLRQDKLATKENLWQESKSREESLKRAQEEVIILRKQLEKQGQYAADLAKEVEDYKLQASQAQLENQAAHSSHAQEIAKIMEEEEVRIRQLTTSHEKGAVALRLERDGLKGRLDIVESELLGAEKRADSSIKTLEVKVEKLQAREQTLEERLQKVMQDADSFAQAYAEEKKELEANASSLSDQYQRASQNVEVALQEGESYRQQIDGLKEELGRRSNEDKEWELKLASIEQELRKKEDLTTSLKSETEAHLQERLAAEEKLNGTLTNLINKLKEKDARLANLHCELVSQQQGKASTEDQWKSKYGVIENQLREKDQLIKSLQSELSELSSRGNTLDDKVKGLEGNVSKLKTENKDLQQENHSLLVKVEEQASLVIAKHNEMETLKNAMKEMQTRLETAFTEERQEKDRLILSLQAKEEELKALKSAYTRKNTDLKSLENAMEEMQASLAALTEERQDFEQEKNRFILRLQAKEEELKALEKASAKKEELIQYLQSEKSELSSRCVSMEGNASQLRTQNHDYEKENRSLLLKVEEQAGLVMAKNNEMEALENAMKKMEATMTKERQEAEQDKNRLILSLKAKEEELKALEREKAKGVDLGNELRQKEEQIQSLQAEKSELSSRCVSMEGNASQLRTQNHDYEKENRSLLLKVEEQAGLVMAKNNEMEALENAMKKMEATMTKERQEAEQDKNRLILSLKAKEEELKALEREKAKGVDLGNELRQKEEQIQSLQAEKSELSSRCVSMEGNVSKLEAQDSGLQKENDNLSMKVLSIEEEANLLMVKQRQEYEQEKNRLRFSLQAKEEELRALERASAKRMELEEGLRQKEEHIQYLQSEKSKLSSRGVSMEDNVSKLEALNNDLQKENRNLLVKIQDLKEQIHELTNRLLQESQEAEERRNNSHQLVTRQEISSIPRPLSPSSNATSSSELVFVLETGAWHIRAGWVHMDRLEALDVPTLVARPRNENGDLWAIVQNAGLQASPMYMKFRDQGVFLCNDAWYCSFEHPDPVLRSALKLEGPLVRGRLERPIDLQLIWQDVLEKMKVDVSTAPIVVTYKPTTTPKERAKLVEILFESCEATRVRFLNEAFILSSVAKAATALVLDIGEDESRVVPVYEQLVVDVAIKTAPIGGADLTSYMADMLLSCKNETYSSMVTRRRLDLARKIKERHAYVAKDFAKQTEIMGHFEREKVDVMKFVRDERSRAENDRLRDMKETRHASAIPSPNSLVAYETLLQDGTEISFAVGRERFHCPELLFRPELHEEAKHKISIPDLVLQSLHSLEPDLWEELLQNVVIAGQTSLLPGFPERLTAELKSRLPPKFAKVIRVVTTEGVVVDDCLPLRSIPEGKNDGIEYNSAVWRGAATLSSRILEENCWLDDEVYREKGPSVIEDPTYSGSI